jgi:hypothetical protein
MGDKVWHILEKDGKFAHHISDLQFDAQGVPYVVLEWLKARISPDDEIPRVRVRLDPKYLQKGRFGKANYLYQAPVVWPE